ncbi:lactonase family protein [Paraburkholderia tropica]|uniref:lactonase family protein n=1 Tax=Paraburkholderia tropica TaxID=92647 RepID=UPI00158FB1EB|nr:beta-propeller fold lactonase family protein [Paraburkholderia tropica]
MAKANTFFFVSNAQDGDISVFQLDADAPHLEPVARVPAEEMVMPLAVHPQLPLLFAAVRKAPFSILTYHIDRATGALLQVERTPVKHSLVNLRFDRTGRWLLGASYGANTLTAFGLDESGRLDPTPSFAFTSGQKPHDIVVADSHDVVFVPHLGDDLIHAYHFDEKKGRLSLDPLYALSFPKGTGPRHGALSKDGKFLYVLGELRGTVHVFERSSLDSSFSILQRETSIPSGVRLRPGSARPPSGVKLDDPVSHEDTIYCADIHLSPDGRFLYTSERTRGLITCFSIDPTSGRISQTQTILSVSSPRSFAIDPTGRFVVVAGQTSEHVALYSVDSANGELNLVSQATGGKDANWVATCRFELPSESAISS